MNCQKFLKYLIVACFLLPLKSYSDIDQRCRNVRIGTVGWLDAGATSSIAHGILLGLGYNATIQPLSTADILASLKNKDLDVFLELMIPTMGEQLRPYLLDNSVELLTENMANTKYSLAANKSAHNLGINTFSDIAKFATDIGKKIYTSEPGSDGHRLTQSMITENLFGLGEFEVITTNETQLILELTKAAQLGKPMVFLGWEPHPMNIRFDLSFLTGGASVFGENFGGADVYTLIRPDLAELCPNLKRFLKNLRFELALINEVMTGILDLKARPTVAAIASIRQQPELLKPWLEGVSHANGDSGLAQVRQFLGL